MHQNRPSSHQPIDTLINNYLPRLVNYTKRHQRIRIDVLDEVSPVAISLPKIIDAKMEGADANCLEGLFVVVSSSFVNLVWVCLILLNIINFHNFNVNLKYQTTTQRNQLRVVSANNVFSSSLKSLLWFSWL